ncbi:nuclear fragile X mental retardation-interacting protein 1-domain-containing protein [Daedaleopsis nitida]|nr:nuclear fragile X mental retardation-interacting protein 1-domain-containing protein [Daedaleopsis nitida]
MTADGYTLSSTYVPGTQNTAPRGPRQIPGHRVQTHSHGGGQAPVGWYQPGTCRCSMQGCSFTGSKKAVDIHMMDRHLVYPPGWEYRKRKNDWDADPSLKGKPVPIQGTSIKLDTPEAIAEWIAERKKRFPTAQSVAEKQQKMREAVERGQLPFDDGHRWKRRRTDDGPEDKQGNYRGRGGNRSRGRGRGRGRGVDGGWAGRNALQQQARSPPAPPPRSTASQPVSVPAIVPDDGEDSTSDSDTDGAPEVVSSKPPPSTTPLSQEDTSVQAMVSDDEASVGDVETPVQRIPQAHKKPRPKEPRKPLHNPFAQRPSLLRNLLLPEIRMTVSNLSQAMRFLVDNDFLDNVELKPGQAGERMIEVIGEQPYRDANFAIAAPAKPASSGSDNI